MIIRRSARKHPDRIRYMVSVLFLHGLSERVIAQKLGRAGLARLSKGQCSGIINQTPFRGLSDDERQERLNALRQHRLDIVEGKPGKLEDWAFTITAKDGRGGS